MKLYTENNETIPAIQILPDSDPIPSGYTDSSQDLIAWKNHGEQKCSDYLQFKDRIKEQLNIKTWDNLSNEEKDFTIEIDARESILDVATDASNKITHLLTTGQAADTESARIIIVKAWARQQVRRVKASAIRANSVAVLEAVGTYLSVADATDFFITVTNLFTAFEKQGIMGTQDGSSEDALFDYIESTTGTVYEFAGLASKGYTMQNGDVDETNFISAIMDILRHGEYIN